MQSFQILQLYFIRVFCFGDNLICVYSQCFFVCRAGILFKNIFAKKLNKLYNLKEDGKYVYKDIMYKEITLIDPAINTAKELYNHLNNSNLFGENNINNSEFYISVPNTLNKDVKLDSLNNFTYEYKYGRTAGVIQEYVKQVPFNKSNLHPEVIKMLKDKTPFIYQMIIDFNQKNEKTKFLRTNTLGLSL